MDQLKCTWLITNTTDIVTVLFSTTGQSSVICNWNIHRYPFLLLERSSLQDHRKASYPAASEYTMRIQALKVKRGYYLLDMEVEVVWNPHESNRGRRKQVTTVIPRFWRWSIKRVRILFSITIIAPKPYHYRLILGWDDGCNEVTTCSSYSPGTLN